MITIKRSCLYFITIMFFITSLKIFSTLWTASYPGGPRVRGNLCGEWDDIMEQRGGGVVVSMHGKGGRLRKAKERP